MNKQQLLVQLQSEGVQLLTAEGQTLGRRGGAGPSDHKAMTIDGTTVMVPVYTESASDSAIGLKIDGKSGTLLRNDAAIANVELPQQPKFYELTTADGIPYSHIALLHSRDVLATTLLQTCLRYDTPGQACQFCAIGQSLAAGRTIARKSPEQLAEVAEAAVRLDGVKQLIMTTGTPNRTDRGAAYLARCAAAVKAQVPHLPIQAQCEPPDDFVWFQRMRDAGVDNLGMHLEAVEPRVRSQVMPGKSEVPVSYYLEAFAAAVNVFGRGQVSTYLLAGLGDSFDALVSMCDRLIDLGVYPFLVPFVPLAGTPLAKQSPPKSEFMRTLYERIGTKLQSAELFASDTKAGCAKCGACSALSAFEHKVSI
ncbi:MAG: MSMEG_0568 family radical SAM protein [Cyanobacteria bacterium P01_H01_bin.15]